MLNTATRKAQRGTNGEICANVEGRRFNSLVNMPRRERGRGFSTENKTNLKLERKIRPKRALNPREGGARLFTDNSMPCEGKEGEKREGQVTQ